MTVAAFCASAADAAPSAANATAAFHAAAVDVAIVSPTECAERRRPRLRVLFDFKPGGTDYGPTLAMPDNIRPKIAEGGCRARARADAVAESAVDPSFGGAHDRSIEPPRFPRRRGRNG